ncbi:hypothetical protein CJP74_03445, partial [Psittacicella melopsittaci]
MNDLFDDFSFNSDDFDNYFALTGAVTTTDEHLRSSIDQFTDITFIELPKKLLEKRINPNSVNITFTTTQTLKEFLDVYIDKFNDINGEPLDLSFINMEQIENIDYLFASEHYKDALINNYWGSFSNYPKRELNIDLNSLDFSNIKSMQGTFAGAQIYCPLNLNVSQVRNMRGMFFGASFNHPDIDLNSWDVSKVTDMSWMFKDASTFNQNIADWNVSNVTDMSSMFEGASSFNQ